MKRLILMRPGSALRTEAPAFPTEGLTSGTQQTCHFISETVTIMLPTPQITEKHTDEMFRHQCHPKPGLYLQTLEFAAKATKLVDSYPENAPSLFLV